MFDIVKNYKMLPRGIMSIPVGREDLIPAGHEIIDKRSLHELPFPNARFPLRDGQQEVYDTVDGSCFINALVGWGRRFALPLSN